MEGSTRSRSAVHLEASPRPRPLLVGSLEGLGGTIRMKNCTKSIADAAFVMHEWLLRTENCGRASSTLQMD